MAERSDVASLKRKAIEVRKNILKMIYTAQSGHPGGSLSAADMMTALYFDEMSIDPDNPGWDDRDRFILSKGHVCPVLYTCLGMRGYFDEKELLNLRKEGSILQGHPDMKRCPGVDISTGSLGQGLSVGVGMAIRAKRDGKDYRVFVLIGDGETQEGQIWEAVQAAVKYELDNLVILVDQNNLQNDNCCDVVMPTGDLAQKFRAFGCHTEQIDGHDMEQVVAVLEKTRSWKGEEPVCIVMKTIKGRGVSYMENVVKWHGVAPNEAEYIQAIEEVEAGLQ